jgi:hypothetical protein
LTDGRCFARACFDESHESAVALAFDHSHSMARLLPVSLPVGLAMGEALASDPEVAVAVWRFGDTVEQLARIDQLRSACLMGSTMTHLVLEAIGQWLETQAAPLKTVVLFTDGEPTEGEAARRAVRRLRRCGHRFLLGSLGVGRQVCAENFPGAVVFDVEPATAAGSLQNAIRRIHRQPGRELAATGD